MIIRVYTGEDGYHGRIGNPYQVPGVIPGTRYGRQGTRRSSIGPGQMTTGIDTPLPGIQQQQMKWCCNCAYNAQLTYSNTDFHNSYKRYGCGSCHQSMYSSKNIFSSKCKWCDQPKNKHIHVDSPPLCFCR
eukprot:2189661-Rhodomonas_salina.1